MAFTYGFILGNDTTSAEFSNAFHALVGDGVTVEGTKFALTLNGFRATVGSGAAMAAGRWLYNDSPLVLALPVSNNNTDRTDAIAVRVDYAERKAALEVIRGVDPDAIRQNPELIRTTAEYSIFLYLIRVRRGSLTLSPDDVTDVRTDGDLCGMITPLSEISLSVIRVYDFLTSGIDEEVARIVALADALIARGQAQIDLLNAYAKEVHAIPDIGEIMISYACPVPEAEWLQCSGGSVPASYSDLSMLLNGTLPKIENGYIYGGKAV